MIELFGHKIQTVSEEKLEVNGIYMYAMTKVDGTACVKIGEAMRQTIRERLYNQQHVDNILKNVIAIWPLEKGLPLGQDKKVHSELQLYKGTCFKPLQKGIDSGTDEAYEVYSSDGLNKIISLCDGVYGPHIKDRKIIYEDIRHLVSKIVDCRKSFVLKLCPRYGKTNTVLLLTKRLNKTFNIMLSYVGTVNESYRKTIEENAYDEDFSKIQYVDLDKDDASDKVEYALENGLQVFAYLQCTGNDGTFEKRYQKIKKFLNKKNAILFIEEADFGMHCDNQLSKLKQIPHRYAYILSGTGNARMQKIADALKIKDWIIRDYLRDLIGTNFEDRAKDVAPIKWIRFHNRGLFEQIEDKKPEQAECWSEMFTVENGKLKYENYFRQFLNALFNPSCLRWADEKYLDCLQNDTLYQDADVATEIFVPSGNDAHKLFCGIIESQIPNAIAIPVDGDETTNKDAEKRVKHEIKVNRGKRIFIVCSDMANRSFSIGQIKNIVLMLDCPGQDSVVQKLARGLTAWHGKECCILDMRLSQEVGNLDKWLAPTMMELAKEGKTYGEITNIIYAYKKAQFYDYFDLSSPNDTIRELDKDDLSKAMYSNDFTELFQGRLDANNISYDLSASPSLDVQDKLLNDNLKGDRTTFERKHDADGRHGQAASQDEDEVQQCSNKRQHQLFLLNAKSLFYDDVHFKENIVESTIKSLIDAGKSDEYMSRLSICLKFLLKIIDLYKKEGYDFDKIIKDGKISCKKENIFFQKLFCDKEQLWDLVFKDLEFKDDDNVLVAFWGNYYFVNKLREKFPKVNFYQMEEYLLDADYLTGKLTSKHLDGFINIIKSMKFDKIIMNPPYDGSLHLKILSEAMKYSEIVINLSPIKWKNPISFYESSSKKIIEDFSKIFENLASLKVISSEENKASFNTNDSNDIGIYFIHNDGKKHTAYEFIKGPETDLACKMISSIKVSIENVTTIQPTSSNFFRLPTIYGNENKEWLKRICSPKIERYYNINPGKKHCCPFINFNSYEECVNFHKSLSLKSIRWLHYKCRFGANIMQKVIPYLGDYTHPWTDEDLYKYFNLTEDEIKMIEDEIR